MTEFYFNLNLGSLPSLWARGEKKFSKRGHEGIEPSTSPTLKENHTTRPMAHARGDLGSASRYTGPHLPPST